jgi:integrase
MATQNVIFKLREPKPNTPTPIHLIIYFDKIRFKYSTGEKIIPEYWNAEENRPFLKNTEEGLTKKMNAETIRDNEKINFRLNEFKSATKKYFEFLAFQREPITPERLKELFTNDFRPEQKKKKPKKIDLNSYIESFIQDIETGKRLTPKGERFRPNTVKGYKAFQKLFNTYQNDKHRKLNFNHITIDFYQNYLEYLSGKDYKVNYIGKNIKILKTIMRAAQDEGHHTNEEMNRKQFKTLKTEVDTVYLTEKEINKLKEVELSDEPHMEKFRDVFLVGIYTAQRFSDYSRIKKDNIKTLSNGTKVIQLHQTKTGAIVTIPIKQELNEILKKYDYNLPKTHEQKVNLNIKTICEKAKIKEPIETETIKGGLKVKTTTPKHKLITTHTARRTGATLMYLNGIPTIAAMKITGHKTEKQFMQYIKVTNEENAQNLALHPYFQSSPLKKVE